MYVYIKANVCIQISQENMLENMESILISPIESWSVIDNVHFLFSNIYFCFFLRVNSR
jgi:hypothetical protein